MIGMIYKPNDFLPFMRDINSYNTKLSSLYEKWDNAKLLCEMNCPVQSKAILPKMAHIQNIFFELQNRLISTLIEETLKKTNLTLYSTAQFAIDILMRNLYERTADVGFLATDNEIINFILNQTEQSQTDIVTRLKKYVDKYTVYHDIIILDTNSKVLVNLDENNDIVGKIIEGDALDQIMNSTENYLEVYKKTPLLNGKMGHIFLGRIYNNDSVIGVICLCFKFENEMASIFKKLEDENNLTLTTIIDSNNTVIASSDENQIPLGVKMTPSTDINEIVYYRGVKYISKTVDSTGYQGYMGLEWRTHIMLPLHIAYDEKVSKIIKSVDQEIVAALLEDSYYFSPDLTEILSRTREVNQMLRRFVYNGQLMNSAETNSHEVESLKPLFRHIDKVGQLTKSYFDKSIKSLFATIISSSLSDVEFISSLCIDIMDRNLYERADDCRWWALNSTFKETLSKETLSEADTARLTSILEYLNSLYTVYKNLFLFDREGRVIAVSNPSYADNINEVLHDKYITNTLANSTEQNYFVSSFKSSKQYKNKPTYIYSASITNNGITVGGIGIVFDGKEQFGAMLTESLKTKENSFALFVDKKANIIASTNPDLKEGTKWNFMQSLNISEHGDSYATLISYENAYYSVGYTKSKGYREYKNQDNYSNEVYAVVFEKLSKSTDTFIAAQDEDLLDTGLHILKEGESVKQIAVFVVNGQYYAFDRNDVKDVIDPNIIEIPEASEWTRGVVLYENNVVLAINSGKLLGGTDAPLANHLLIVKTEQNYIAVEASDLNTVLEIAQNQLVKIQEFHLAATRSLVQGIVSVGEEGQKKNIIMLNSGAIIEKVSKQILDEDLLKYQEYISKLPKNS